MGNKTRTERWRAGISKLYEGLDILDELRQDYKQWRDNLSESLENTTCADKLDAIQELPWDELESAINDLEAADLPLGFGRD